MPSYAWSRSKWYTALKLICDQTTQHHQLSHLLPLKELVGEVEEPLPEVAAAVHPEPADHRVEDEGVLVEHAVDRGAQAARGLVARPARPPPQRVQDDVEGQPLSLGGQRVPRRLHGAKMLLDSQGNC